MLPKLQFRAHVLTQIRHFFASRNILEVETPLLYPGTIPSPNIHSFSSIYNFCNVQKKLYLQTSPEFAMKRLLAGGSGDIYQICKAFRNEEQGRLHNYEFTILEWYRIGYDHHKLMNEMDELLQFILNTSPAERLSYQQLFLHYLQIDPLTANIDTLKTCAANQQLNPQNLETIDKDDWLQLLLSHCIEPHLGKITPVFVYNFPASQAALAKINDNDPRIANRFEVYLDGIELANGFHELNDATEQRRRFNIELQMRKNLGLPAIPIDEDFLSALSHLPECAGVALGVDRLLLIKNKVKSLADVLPLF